MTTRYILLGGQLVQPYSNTEIDPYANNYVSVLAVDPDFAINSTYNVSTPQLLKGIAEPTFTNIIVIPTPTVNPAITVTFINSATFGNPYFIMETLDPFPGITSTTTVPTDSVVNYMRFINLSLSEINDVRNYPIDPLRDAGVGDTSYYSIKSTQTYGNFTSVPGISFTTTPSTSFNSGLDLVRGLAPSSVLPSLVFGVTTLNMEIDDPDQGTQLMPIESTLTMGSFYVGKAISPVSISSTKSYGLPSFGDFIHRTLIFKNDNLGKIGPQDSVEIVNGLVFNPVFETANTEVQSGDPVGSISVSVSGTDYKLPFYSQLPSSSGTLLLAPYVTVANVNAKFATKSYAASNTYVSRYLEVANSTSFITSSELTPYISVVNANAKFATKAYAASNTYVNTHLNKYLQVANSNVSNWNTAYGWGNHASAGYLSGSISSLTNGTDTLSLNGSNKVDLPGGTAYIFSATNNVTLSADTSGDNILEIINNVGATLYTDRSFEIRTNKGISDKTFTFTQGGGLTFPDATTQTTAWSNNALRPYITVANTNAKFATKAYAASNTYVQRYLQVANSTSFITSSALTPYISVANTNAKFATKAYASSNTYVNTQLNKYLQVANSSVSNWNTAYGWGNHASVGYLTSVSWAQVTDKPANILTLNDVNVVSNDMLVNDSITIGSTAVALGQNITTLTGLTGVTSNAATAFIAGTAAESGVALQMPREGALRNMTNGQNTMYFDVSNGGTAHGSFRFRSSSNFTELLDISTDGLRAITAYKGKTSFNVAIDTVVTVDNIKYRISNQSGVFPQIASASGSTVDVCYDVLGIVSGVGTTNAQNSGYILASNGTWLSIYSTHGMDTRGDRLTAHITDKAAGKIYRATFMVTNNSNNTTGYNIIVERIL